MTVKLLTETINALEEARKKLLAFCDYYRENGDTDGWCDGCPFYEADSEVDNEYFTACIPELIKNGCERISQLELSVKPKESEESQEGEGEK